MRITQAPIVNGKPTPKELPFDATSSITVESLRSIAEMLARSGYMSPAVKPSVGGGLAVWTGIAPVTGLGGLTGFNGVTGLGAAPPFFAASTLKALSSKIDLSHPLLLPRSLLGPSSRITLPAPTTLAAGAAPVLAPAAPDRRAWEGRTAWFVPVPRKSLENAYHALNALQLGGQFAGFGVTIPHGSQIEDVGDAMVAAVAVALFVDEIKRPQIQDSWKRFAFFAKLGVSVLKGITPLLPVSPTVKHAIQAFSIVVKFGDEVHAIGVRTTGTV